MRDLHFCSYHTTGISVNLYFFDVKNYWLKFYNGHLWELFSSFLNSQTQILAKLCHGIFVISILIWSTFWFYLILRMVEICADFVIQGSPFYMVSKKHWLFLEIWKYNLNDFSHRRPLQHLIQYFLTSRKSKGLLMFLQCAFEQV